MIPSIALAQYVIELGFYLPVGDGSYIDVLEPKPRIRRKRIRRGPPSVVNVDDDKKASPDEPRPQDQHRR